jgi:hypothetical protein
MYRQIPSIEGPYVAGKRRAHHETYQLQSHDDQNADRNADDRKRRISTAAQE